MHVQVFTTWVQILGNDYIGGMAALKPSRRWPYYAIKNFKRYLMEFYGCTKGHHKRLLWKIVECLSAQASNAEAASVAKTAQNPTWVKWRKKMKNVLPNSFEFLIHQFNSLNRELIHELWINSSIQPVSESYAQRFYHWGHAGVQEIFCQQTLGCPLNFV